MVAPVKISFKMYQGSTFSEVLRWESSTKVYKSITGISKTAPAIVTAIGHGCPIGWRAKITGVVGMKEINSDDTYNLVTATTSDSITLNDVNASSYTQYTSGGILEYNAPTDLTGYTARMQLREKISSSIVLLELTTENSSIILDNTTKTITLNIDAIACAGLTFNTAVYSLEMIKSGVVTPFITGTVTLIKEVTR